MKKVLLILSGLILTFNLNAQLHTEINNELKYWKLRGRLIGDENNRDKYNGFMVIGILNSKK